MLFHFLKKNMGKLPSLSYLPPKSRCMSKEGRNPLDVRRRRTTQPEAMTPDQAHRRLAFILLERSVPVVDGATERSSSMSPKVKEVRKAMRNEDTRLLPLCLKCRAPICMTLVRTFWLVGRLAKTQPNQQDMVTTTTNLARIWCFARYVGSSPAVRSLISSVRMDTSMYATCIPLPTLMRTCMHSTSETCIHVSRSNAGGGVLLDLLATAIDAAFPAQGFKVTVADAALIGKT